MNWRRIAIAAVVAIVFVWLLLLTFPQLAPDLPFLPQAMCDAKGDPTSPYPPCDT